MFSYKQCIVLISTDKMTVCLYISGWAQDVVSVTKDQKLNQENLGWNPMLLCQTFGQFCSPNIALVHSAVNKYMCKDSDVYFCTCCLCAFNCSMAERFRKK